MKHSLSLIVFALALSGCAGQSVGIGDGRMTEVSGEGIQEGLAVITDQRAAGAAQ